MSTFRAAYVPGANIVLTEEEDQYLSDDELREKAIVIAHHFDLAVSDIIIGDWRD